MHLGDELRATCAQRRRPRASTESVSATAGSERLAHPARDQRRNQALAIGTLLLDRLDEEPEARQRFGEELEIVVG